MAAISSEIREAHEQNREIAVIRVTLDAIPGSLITLPVTPERLRRYAARWGEDGLLVADLSVQRFETLIHPQDFYRLLKESNFMGFGYGDSPLPLGTVTHVLGVRIQRDV